MYKPIDRWLIRDRHTKEHKMITLDERNLAFLDYFKYEVIPLRGCEYELSLYEKNAQSIDIDTRQ